MAYIQDQLNRSHRAPQSTIDSLEQEQERLQGLMDEIDFVDWEEESWDDDDWNQSNVDDWLFFYEDVSFRALELKLTGSALTLELVEEQQT